MILITGSWVLALYHERMKKREADGAAFGELLEAALHSGRVNGHMFTDTDVLHERPLLSTEYELLPDDYAGWEVKS